MAKAKDIVGLDCRASATSCVLLVLRTRLEEMCQFRAVALDWSDIEGVHDMRVASRRLRSALRDFKPYLRMKKMRRASEYLKFIADALGAVRDHDVAILALEELKQEAPEETLAGIEHLIAERAAAREQARAALTEAISEGAIERLRGEFIYSLERAAKASPVGDAAAETGSDVVAQGLSFHQAGREIIAARWEELQGLSASLYQPFETEPLHQMRIAGKRLRYAIELFTPAWGESLVPFAKEMTKLQSHLGEVHDCDEWIAALGARLNAGPIERSATEAETDGEIEVEKRRALFWLLGSFTKERTKHYCAALERAAEWEDKSFAANLMASLAREPEPIEPTHPDSMPEAEPQAIGLQNA
ncbi:MAG TPA: CHAD domain-containing protein [Pyrinomonadaceae bacterium]|jgi:CHAD domain-containing protein